MGEWVVTPNVEAYASELALPPLFAPVVRPIMDGCVGANAGIRDALSRLASFLKGDGLPDRCRLAAAAAVFADVPSALAIPGGEMAETGGGEVVLVCPGRDCSCC